MWDAVTGACVQTLEIRGVPAHLSFTPTNSSLLSTNIDIFKVESLGVNHSDFGTLALDVIWIVKDGCDNDMTLSSTVSEAALLVDMDIPLPAGCLFSLTFSFLSTTSMRIFRDRRIIYDTTNKAVFSHHTFYNMAYWIKRPCNKKAANDRPNASRRVEEERRRGCGGYQPQYGICLPISPSILWWH